MSSTAATTTAAGKEMAQKWSQTASPYARYFAPSGVILGRSLVNSMQMQFQEKSLDIIEVGAGGGNLAREVLNLHALSCSKFVVTDIADGMLEKAKETLQGQLVENGGCVTIENADFAKLQYPDETFDRYVSNLCLHYAPDPDVVVREAARVLKSGGIAGMTIWGRSAVSPMMTIVPDVLDDLGLCKKDPTKRSNFHLGEDDDALRQKFLQNGFRKCIVAHVPFSFVFFDAAGYVETIVDGAASTKKQVEAFSEEDQKRVRDEIHKRASEIIEKGNPISMDMAMIIAKK